MYGELLKRYTTPRQTPSHQPLLCTLSLCRMRHAFTTLAKSSAPLIRSGLRLYLLVLLPPLLLRISDRAQYSCYLPLVLHMVLEEDTITRRDVVLKRHHHTVPHLRTLFV